MTKQKQVTIYVSGEVFGNVQRHEGRLIEHGKRPYAQYKDAPYVDFIPKGKRKGVRIQKDYKPYLLIVEGEGPEMPDLFISDGSSKRTRYHSHAAEWREEADAILDPFIGANPERLIVDYRYKEARADEQKAAWRAAPECGETSISQEIRTDQHLCAD